MVSTLDTILLPGPRMGHLFICLYRSVALEEFRR
jgi:hypothetical protein